MPKGQGWGSAAEPECRRFCFCKAPALLQVSPGSSFGNTQRSRADLWSRGLCSLPTGSLGGSTGMAGFTAPPPCHAPPVGSVPAEAGCGHAAQRLACVLPQRVGRKRALGALRRAAACALRGGDKGSKSTSGEHGHGPGFVQPGRKKHQQQGRDWVTNEAGGKELCCLCVALQHSRIWLSCPGPSNPPGLPRSHSSVLSTLRASCTRLK